MDYTEKFPESLRIGSCSWIAGLWKQGPRSWPPQCWVLCSGSGGPTKGTHDVRVFPVADPSPAHLIQWGSWARVGPRKPSVGAVETQTTARAAAACTVTVWHWWWEELGDSQLWTLIDNCGPSSRTAPRAPCLDRLRRVAGAQVSALLSRKEPRPRELDQPL